MFANTESGSQEEEILLRDKSLTQSARHSSSPRSCGQIKEAQANLVQAVNRGLQSETGQEKR